MLGHLPEKLLIELAAEHLGGLPEVSLAPHIPERKLRNARKAHALHLAAKEPIVVLYDATTLGGGEDGFLVTPAQLCWKSFMEHPRRILWEDLAGTPIHTYGRHVSLRRGEIPTPWGSGAAERVGAFLTECGRRAEARGGTPYRDASRPDLDSSLADTILRVARRAFGEPSYVHYRPSIPPKMLARARVVHEKHLAEGEEILVLYDDTILGSGSDGMIFSEQRFCWRGFMGPAEAVTWRKLPLKRVTSDGAQLIVVDHRPIDFRTNPGMASLVASVLRELARASGLAARPVAG